MNCFERIVMLENITGEKIKDFSCNGNKVKFKKIYNENKIRQFEEEDIVIHMMSILACLTIQLLIGLVFTNAWLAIVVSFGICCSVYWLIFRNDNIRCWEFIFHLVLPFCGALYMTIYLNEWTLPKWLYTF